MRCQAADFPREAVLFLPSSKLVKQKNSDWEDLTGNVASSVNGSPQFLQRFSQKIEETEETLYILRTVPCQLCSEERSRNGSKYRKQDPVLSHTRQAQERIQEFARLQRARYLLDAISLVNELLSDGSDVEILSLASTIVKRLKALGAMHSLPNGKNDNSADPTNISMLKPVHTGVYHCCTFCSSGGKKEVACGCRGTMPGGYRGCGHGHPGHPGVHHWSCCGSILRYGRCLVQRKSICQLLL